jgi:acetolactate synthase-1/2/3 large subunit
VQPLLEPGLLEAMNASVPVVAIIEDAARPDTDKNAVEEVDHQRLFSTCAKWVRRVNLPERIDDYVDMVFRAAASGRPGPAVLCIPRDLQFAPAAEASDRTASLPGYPLDRSLADPERIARVARMIAAAARPLVIAGGGVHLSGAHQELADRQQEFGIPVATTPRGKGAVDETHPLSIGVVSYALALERGHATARRSSTAPIRPSRGHRTGEQTTNAWTPFPPKPSSSISTLHTC